MKKLKGGFGGGFFWFWERGGGIGREALPYMPSTFMALLKK